MQAYTCIHMYIHTYTHVIHTCTDMGSAAWLDETSGWKVCVCAIVCVCVYAYVRVCICVNMITYVFVCVHCTDICAHIVTTDAV